MRKPVVTLVLTGAIGLGFSGDAFAAASSPPSCFGQSAAAFAQSAPGALGSFASSSAHFFNSIGQNIGQNGVPVLKATCTP